VGFVQALQNLLVSRAHNRIHLAGDLTVVSMPVGQIVGRMDRVRPVADIVAELLDGYEEALAQVKATVDAGYRGLAKQFPDQVEAPPLTPNKGECHSNKSRIPSVFMAVWSCMRPGRKAPVHSVRPFSSVATVAFFVFCFSFPEMKARRPGLFARGRRTRTSVGVTA
jgi:hypothetical protein